MTTRVFSEQEKQDFQVAASEAGYVWDVDVILYPYYSGRFMYGKQCFGLTVHFAGIAHYLLGYFARYHQDLSMSLLNSHCVDSLGKDYIVYFPGYLWNEEVAHGTIEAAI